MRLPECASKIRARLSKAAVAQRFPSELKETPPTIPPCSTRSNSIPGSSDQTRASRSEPAEATIGSRGEKAAAYTQLLWLVKVETVRPELTSRIVTPFEREETASSWPELFQTRS